MSLNDTNIDPVQTQDPTLAPVEQSAPEPAPQPEPSAQPEVTPAPAPQPSPEPTVQNQQENQEPSETPAFDPTVYDRFTVEGNEDVGLVLDIFKQNKVSPAVFKAAFGKAMETESASDINMDVLTEALGATNAAIIKKLTQNIASTNEAAADKIRQEAYDTFGGEQRFKNCVEWTKSINDPTVKAKIDSYKAMIDQGGEQRRLGLQALKDLYMTAPNTSVPARDVYGVASAAMPNDAITSRADYFNELQAAERAGNHALIADINRRWSIGKKYI